MWLWQCRARPIRDLAASVAIAGLVIAAWAVAQPDAGLFPWIALVEAAAWFVLARQYREPGLSWLGSLLVLGALVLRLHAELPALPWSQLWLLALLAHGSLALAAGLLAARLRSDSAETARLYALPLRHSAQISTLVAFTVLLFALERGRMEFSAACALWLAVLWLVCAWKEASPAWFAAFQALLAFAVVLGVCSSLERYEWFGEYPRCLTDMRSFHAIATGLGALSLAWVVIRLALRKNASANVFLEPAWPAVDRSMLVTLTLLQSGVAIAAVWPDVVRELASSRIAPIVQPQTTFGSWVLLGVLGAAWIASLWARWQPYTLHGLGLVALAVPFLAAANVRADVASASALRWGLTLVFLGWSIACWLRSSLSRLALRLGCPVQVARAAFNSVRALVLVFTLGLVVVFSLASALLAGSGVPPGGPLGGSIFASIGWPASYVTPLLLLSFALAGHAVRERQAAYSVGAGLLTNLAASLLVWHFHRGVPAVNWWTPMLQVNALLFAGAALASLTLSRRRAAEAISKATLDMQLALGALANGVVLLWSLSRFVIAPGGPFPATVFQAGSGLGWAALLTCAVAAVWHDRRYAPAQCGRSCVGACILLGVLAASTCSRWDSGDGLAYHVLTSFWCAIGVTLLAASWATPASAGYLPRRDAQRGIFCVGILVLGLAWRGVGGDPGWPTWSVAGTLTVMALYGALAVWMQRPAYVYLSGLLVNVAGILLWRGALVREFGFVPLVPWGPGILDKFILVNVICFALASTAWSACELALRSRTPLIDVRGRFVPFSHVAAFAGLNLLTILVAVAVAGDVMALPMDIASPLAWFALAATVIALSVCAWDPQATFTSPGLYGCGIVALGMVIHAAHPSPRAVGRSAAWMLGGYVLLTSAAGWLMPRLTRLRWKLRLPDTALSWSEPWFLFTQAAVAALAGALGVWTVCTFSLLTERLTGSATLLMLLPAGVLLTGAVSGRGGDRIRHVALSLVVCAMIAAGWVFIDPSSPVPWLHRSTVLLVALAGATQIYGRWLERWLPNQLSWGEAARRLAPVFGALSLAAAALVMAQEFLSYNPDEAVRRTPMAWWAIAAVAGTLAGMIAAGIGMAVSEKPDPFQLSPRGRTTYVYVSEILLVILLTHLRLNVPEIFPRVGRYWPLVAMAVAYLGAGLGVLLRRKGLEVLAAPWQNTGVFLPLLPLLGFWAKPPQALQHFVGEHVPGMAPWLQYVARLPQYFQDHAAVWFLVGLLYAGVAVANRSFWFAVAAALAANFGLWALWHHHGLAFLVHPQLWLIPVALMLLTAEHFNRERLNEYQRQTLRYAGLLLLYVSSTADMFIAGLGNSVILPVALAVLSVLGVLAGILLQVRAFMFMGFSFLFVVVFSMIWHAAVDRYQTWIWWASGVVLGALILALFAVFEKRRNDVLQAIERVKAWE